MKRKLSDLRSFFYLLPDIFSAFFSKPETINYPNGSSEYSSSFRGIVRINSANCVGCSMCVLDCPASALKIERISKQSFKLIHFRDRCTYCGQCEKSCKFDAIYLDHRYYAPSDNRDDFYTILVDRKIGEE